MTDTQASTSLLPIFLGLGSLASAAIGSVLTYVWQVLSNRRQDEAIRAQTRGRMISLTIVSATFAKIGSGTSKGIVLPKGIAILARRHLDNLDSPSVALAYARQRYALDIIAQIDFHLELAIQEAEEAEEMDVVMNASILADYRSRMQREWQTRRPALHRTLLRQGYTFRTRATDEISVSS